jgi:hypothetical protein
MPDILRVIVSNPHLRHNGAPRYECRLGNDLLCLSHQPIYDVARVLLKRGYDPATPLTTRHAGSPHDSFIPAPLGRLAKWTVTERDRGGLSVEPWMPYEGPRAAPPARPKTRESAPGGIPAPPGDSEAA